MIQIKIMLYKFRYFRIVEAKKFVAEFSSDRGHMLEGDHWMSPPPTYPPILNEGI